MKKSIVYITFGVCILLAVFVCFKKNLYTIEDSSFINAKKPLFKGHTDSSGKKVSLFFYNNPFALTDKDSIELFLNNFLIYSGTYKKTSEVILPQKLMGKYVQSAIKIMSNGNEYWSVKRDYAFKVSAVDSLVSALSIVFTPDSYNGDPYIISEEDIQ